MLVRRSIVRWVLAVGTTAGGSAQAFAQSQLLPVPTVLPPADCAPPVPYCPTPTARLPACPPASAPLCLPAQRVRVIVPPPEVVFREATCRQPGCAPATPAAGPAAAPVAAPTAAVQSAMATVTHTYTVPYLTYHMVPVATTSLMGGASFNVGAVPFHNGATPFGVLPGSFAQGGFQALSYGAGGSNLVAASMPAGPNLAAFPSGGGLTEGELQSFRTLLARLRGGDTRPVPPLLTDRGDGGLAALLAALTGRDCDPSQHKQQADIDAFARKIDDRIRQLAEDLKMTNEALKSVLGEPKSDDPAGSLRERIRKLEDELKRVKGVKAVSDGLKKD